VTVTASGDFFDDGASTPSAITNYLLWQTDVSRPRVTAPPVEDPSWTPKTLLEYHSEFVTLRTRPMEQALAQLKWTLLVNNRQRGTARRGLIVSGPPGAGKSTMLMELGRSFELSERRRLARHDGYMPVAFGAIPPSSTPKGLVKELARFACIPVHDRMTETTITDAVCHVLCERRTRLVFIDDVHLLNTRTRPGADTSDQVKTLAERVPATFVLAGVDVEKSPLLTGPRGAQLAARFKILRTPPLLNGTAEQKAAAVPAERHGDGLAAGPPPARNAGAARRLHSPAHLGSDVQPVSPDPGSGHSLGPGREPCDYEEAAVAGGPRCTGHTGGPRHATAAARHLVLLARTAQPRPFAAVAHVPTAAPHPSTRHVRKTMPVEALASTPTPVRIPPTRRELTGSWLRRMTAPYGLPAQDLLRGLLSGPHRVQVTGSPGTGLELFLNIPAQRLLAQSAGLPLSRLTALLPALTGIPERLADPSTVQAAWYMPREPWVGACPECSGRLWLTRRPVLAYPGVAGHVCRRHRRWLLADADKPTSVALQTLPEVLAAHRQHCLLVRTRPYAPQAVALAAAVVWSWQVQGWKAEAIWEDRARRVADLLECTPAAVAPHALLTYPETISVARLLSAPHWQQRLRSSASEKNAAAAALVQEIGRRVGRPWLADWLNARARVRPGRLHTRIHSSNGLMPRQPEHRRAGCGPCTRMQHGPPTTATAQGFWPARGPVLFWTRPGQCS
jgi:hypothetical protein